MTMAISRLDTHDLVELASALRTDRLRSPYSSLSLKRIVSTAASEPAANGLNELVGLGVPPAALANVIDLVVAGRTDQVTADNLIDLVTSGPEGPTSVNRDTAVVVRDLFAYAERSVWIAGYAVHRGKQVFAALADRMASNPALEVVLILDVRRGPGDTTANEFLLGRFRDQFRKKEWPDGRPLPKVFYFPKALESDSRERAALHAKCIVVDSERCFVSSANFTEAAQSKNIEVGLYVRSATVANRLQRYLETLVGAKTVLPLW